MVSLFFAKGEDRILKGIALEPLETTSFDNPAADGFPFCRVTFYGKCSGEFRQLFLFL